MTASRRGDYDRSVLPITVPERHIPLTAIRDAATAVYAAAIRTPLVRVELRDSGVAEDVELFLKLEVLQPIGSFTVSYTHLTLPTILRV